MTFKKKWLALVAGGLTAALVLVVQRDQDLVGVHQEIVDDYLHVEHIAADEFSVLDQSAVVVFDVREPEEFAVSHMEHAIRVSPEISSDEFEAAYGSKIQGKTVVFYCSVGRRSSYLAERLDDLLGDVGAVASYNLVGGLFQWRNEDRPLVGQSGIATDAIHPYDDHWGRFIKDKSAIRYQPEHRP